MPKLRDLRYQQVIRALQSLGWSIARQKGSHISLVKPGSFRPIVIPAHSPVKLGTLLSNLRTAGISKEQFESALD